LLYVALTRAEDELYIVGYKDDKKIPDKCWYSIIVDGIADIAKIENDKMIIKSEQLEEVACSLSVTQRSDDNIQLPSFVSLPVPQEPVPYYPLTPSLIISDDPFVQSPLAEKAVLRGKLIHKLLQYLPDIAVNIREKTATEFVNKYNNILNKEQQREIIDATFKIINDEKLADIFSCGSKSEVPVVGVVENFVISGQIDRLYIKDDSIFVLDYKTNRNPPGSVKYLHQNYVKQMAAYKAALEKIYPGKEIICALIWTAIPMVMYIDNDILDKQLFENH
jgi:ATP-dependent helicase/nuclease subunit A